MTISLVFRRSHIFHPMTRPLLILATVGVAVGFSPSALAPAVGAPSACRAPPLVMKKWEKRKVCDLLAHLVHC